MPVPDRTSPESAAPADPAGSAPPADRPLPFPTLPLLATLGVQTLATMAAYSLPAVAPAVAQDLGVPGALVGPFISTVYGVGILSAVLSPGFIHRYGAVRVSQVVLLATLAMLAVAPFGGVLAVALGAALLGIAYGATAPASTHLLVPRTPPKVMNLVLSLRQIGVPLGGVLAGLVMPPLTLAFGWRTALLLEAIPVALLLLALQAPRWNWDVGRSPARPILHAGMLAPVKLLAESSAMRRLALVSFVYSGLQLCFIAFMAVHLTGVAGFDLVRAGQALAVYQVAGAVSRPIWGWLADRYFSARGLLALQGLIMCAAAAAAGQFGPAWPGYAVLIVCALGGATASGFTGIAYGEWARLGGDRRTEATGLGAGAMFTGVMVLPTLFSLAVTGLGGYGAAYAAVGVLAAVAGVGLVATRSTSSSL
jgi:MFS family permease